MCSVEGVRLAAADAQVYWMSAKIGTDQFLLYAFDGEPADVEEAVAGFRVARQRRLPGDVPGLGASRRRC
jgi:hypothetical protein